MVRVTKARGAGELTIGIDAPDIDAQRFYARHGFPIGDAYIARREL